MESSTSNNSINYSLHTSECKEVNLISSVIATNMILIDIAIVSDTFKELLCWVLPFEKNSCCSLLECGFISITLVQMMRPMINERNTILIAHAITAVLLNLKI